MAPPAQPPDTTPLDEWPEPADTIVRLPLLPSPDELEQMRHERARIEEHLADQVRVAVRGVAECAAAVGQAGAALDDAVRAARAAGASWVEIGRAVGISRQAAAQRWERKP